MKTAFFLLSSLIAGGALGGGGTYLLKDAEIADMEVRISELTEELERPVVDPYEGLVLPQVYVMAAAYYSAEDLAELQTKVVEPVVAYYEGQGSTVVSISIDTAKRDSSEKNSFTVNCIISQNDGDDEPLSLGFVIEKVDGVLPVWEPLEMGEDYRG